MDTYRHIDYDINVWHLGYDPAFSHKATPISAQQGVTTSLLGRCRFRANRWMLRWRWGFLKCYVNSSSTHKPSHIHSPKSYTFWQFFSISLYPHQPSECSESRADTFWSVGRYALVWPKSHFSDNWYWCYFNKKKRRKSILIHYFQRREGRVWERETQMYLMKACLVLLLIIKYNIILTLFSLNLPAIILGGLKSYIKIIYYAAISFLCLFIINLVHCDRFS